VKRLLYILLAVVVVAGLTLVLWPRGGASAKPLTIAFSQEPNNVVGEYSSMAFTAWLDEMVMAGLGKWDDKNNFIPDLAEEVPTAANGGVSGDGLTITWKLKPGLKWSDGQPLTSKDVLFTWQSQIDKGNAPNSREGYNKIDHIDTPDDTTVVIHFAALYPPWQTLFVVGGGFSVGILPQHILAGKTALEKNPEIHQPTVCAGPFKIKKWVAGDHMILVANPAYYRGAPKLPEIDIKFLPTPEQALAALKTGDIDLVPDFAESDIPTLTKLEPKQHVRVDATPLFEHLFFNLGVTTGAGPNGTGASDVAGFGPFQDVNVRKAIMLGIDRETIVKTLLFGKATVPVSLWPNSSWYNTSLPPYPYDKVQARKLLDAAGYPVGPDGVRAGTYGGRPVKFSLGLETTDKQLRKDVVLAIQANLKEIGIEIRPKHLPAGTFLASYSGGGDLALGKFDMAIFTTGFYPDPDPGDWFLCSGVPSKSNPSGQNWYHYCSPEMDKLFAAGLASADPAVRKTAYDAIQKYQYDNVLFVPLYARANVYGFSDGFVFPPTSSFAEWAWDAWDFALK
jgi:peptide/nickel transport system substrate-binding protein